MSRLHSRFILVLPTCLLLLTMLRPVDASATDLIYTPVNPTFGGNPANASGLMAAASAQNTFKAPTTTTTAKTALERFTENLQTAVLNRLTVTAVNGLFDADGKLLEGRTITAGNFTIAITSENGNLVMNTTDVSTGATTRIVVGNVDASTSDTQ
jgi:curli production assembly/transport component CsgF